ncbi:MAG: sigma-E factor negative regulatory protein [Burkholderiaceae bacterium]|nr:sigma-E factor negative regulatory protein [Burkholderiaceae bacterium]
MNQDASKIREKLSALADGQLHGADFAAAVESIAHDPEARAHWQAYHLIGDVLRGREGAAAPADPDFVLRLRRRLAVEPMRVGAVGREIGATPRAAAAPAAQEAANDGNWRWKLAAALASVAAVAAVGWNVLGVNFAPAVQLSQAAPVEPPRRPASAPEREAQELLAASPQRSAQELLASASDADRPVMLRDARLDELLSAHKQFGGTSALQMPAGFLRNATFEVPAR